MKGRLLDGKRIVDWDDHQKVFRELMEMQSKARLLTVHNRSGTGKSTLLLRLKWLCQTRLEPVPVSLVQLDDLSLKGSFDLISKIRRDLADFDLKFPRFDPLNLARVTFDVSPFEAAAGSITGAVNATNALISGGIVGGTVHHVAQAETVNLTTTRPTAWPSPELELIAARECERGFLEDLRDHAQQRMVVLLIDSWDLDRGSPALLQWIRVRLLNPLCFSPATPPARLLMVVAGRDDLNLKDALGEGYDELVRTHPFKTWDETDIRNFVELHGYEKTLVESDWAVLHTKFKDADFTVRKALNLLEFLRQQNDSE